MNLGTRDAISAVICSAIAETTSSASESPDSTRPSIFEKSEIPRYDLTPPPYTILRQTSDLDIPE